MGKVGMFFIPFPYVAQQPVTNRAGSIGPSVFHLFELHSVEWGVLQRTVFLSIKSGCYNERRCYNERVGILSADVARA